MRAPIHVSRPPYDWDCLKEIEDSDKWLAQWRHYEALLSSFGYRLQWPECTSLERLTKPRFDLPAPLDPYKPELHENLVASPIERFAKVTVSLYHAMVRTATDQVGRFVLIKAVPAASDECAVLRYLRDHRTLHADPANHTIPIFGIIDVDSVVFVVMAQWGYAFPKFYTLGEYVECFRQCLEGLSFMHSHLIAHGDIHNDNIVLNYGGGPPILEPGQPFRSLFVAQYAFIDFGQAVHLPPGSDVASCSVISDIAGIHTPEHSATVPHNPFYSDVYQLAAVFEDVLEQNARSTNLEEIVGEHVPAIYELFDAMMAEPPEERLCAGNALQWLVEIHDDIPATILDLAVTGSAVPYRGPERLDVAQGPLLTPLSEPKGIPTVQEDSMERPGVSFEHEGHLIAGI